MLTMAVLSCAVIADLVRSVDASFELLNLASIVRTETGFSDPLTLDSSPTQYKSLTLRSAESRLSILNSELERNCMGGGRLSPTHTFVSRHCSLLVVGLRLQAYTLLAQQDVEMAIALLDTARTIDPEQPFSDYSTALAYESLAIRDHESVGLSVAQITAKFWRRLGLTADDLIARGDRARMRNNTAEALRWYYRALSYDRLLPENYYYIGAKLVELGDPNTALLSLRTAVQSGTYDRSSLFYLAWAYESVKNYHDAIDSYKTAILLPNSTSVAKVGLSDVYTRLGMLYLYGVVPTNPEDAEHWLSVAIATNDYSDFLRNRFNAAFQLGHLFTHKGKYSEAENMYREALNDAPDSAAAHIAIANVLWLQHRHQEAIRELRVVLEIQPNHSIALLHLSQYLFEVGSASEAKQTLEELLFREPDNRDAAELLARINELDYPVK